MIFKEGQNFEKMYTVTETVYEAFIRVFGDNNPLHSDLSFAKSFGFKNKVMHGNILNGFLSHFVGECLPIKNVIIHSQEIHFKKPVYMGDILNFEAQVKEIHESVNAVELDFRFKNNDQVVAKGKIQIGILEGN
ncbi:MAG: hypothetical protein JNL60_17695 [Bacteroidia bacterium]|nr:hypothetical protein [Bacteroidia bacterium]